jgi:hypothetical protein
MAKAQKKVPKKKRQHKYEEKLKINGSFQDLMNELVPPAKKEEKKKK